jgi:hypothetical protein
MQKPNEMNESEKAPFFNGMFQWERVIKNGKKTDEYMCVIEFSREVIYTTHVEKVQNMRTPTWSYKIRLSDATHPKTTVVSDVIDSKYRAIGRVEGIIMQIHRRYV